MNPSEPEAESAGKTAAIAAIPMKPESETSRSSGGLEEIRGELDSPKPEPTEVELERGILDAVRLGLGDVARTLSLRLEARQRLRTGNVIDLSRRRR